MKTFITSLILSLMVVFVSSCTGPDGPNGKDGKAYAAVTSSDGTLQSGWYFASFPSSGAYSNEYYSALPGTYSCLFETGYYYGSYYYYEDWSGTYTISINKGTAGGKGKIFWQKGDAGQNGADKYYKLDCRYDIGLGVSSENNFWKRGNSSTVPDTSVVGKVYTRDYSDGSYDIHIELQLKNKTVKKVQ